MYDKFEEDDSSWSFALGLLVGAIVGAAVASLFSPRSGTQNREAVIERGLVLRDRVTEATETVTARVRDTATTVKDRAVDGAERIGAAAGATVERVQDVANTAAATVKDAAGTAADRAQTIASTASEKVQAAANTAAATVSEVAGTVSERAQDVAGTVSERAQDVAAKVQGVAGAAAERTRQATGRETVDEFEIPPTSAALDEFEVPAVSATLDEFEMPAASATLDEFETVVPDTTDALVLLDDDVLDSPDSTAALASESRYDAEDVRSAATDSAIPDPEQLETLASIDTFEGATSSSTVLDEFADTLPPIVEQASENEGWSTLEAAVEAAQAEVASSEQFEVDGQSAPLGDDTEPSEAEDEDRRPA